MPRPNYIHLLPERDRAMAETYTQSADGSKNPTGEAQPQDGPQVHRAAAASKKVDAAKAETKVVIPADAENKTAAKPTRKKA